MSRNEWMRSDRDYSNRNQQRQTTMRDHAADALSTSPIANPAIAELYEQVMLHHLPLRFPTMFCISGSRLLNLATGNSHAIDVKGARARRDAAESGRERGRGLLHHVPGRAGRRDPAARVRRLLPGRVSEPCEGGHVREGDPSAGAWIYGEGCEEGGASLGAALAGEIHGTHEREP